jgi:hypothetical protein
MRISRRRTGVPRTLTASLMSGTRSKIGAIEPPSWQGVALWADFADRCSENRRLPVERLLTAADQVLRSGDSSPSDFTLHDEGHARRVAEWIATVAYLDDGTRLSCPDIAMLLLAAYLHDIGMTPPQNTVRQHYDFLLTAEGELESDARLEFQEWLDDERNGLTPPLVATAPLPEDLRRARRIIAAYIRARHNDWSEHWIREHTSPDDDDAVFAGWREDLILLCRSHHYGYEELKGDAFAPRVVGGQGEVLHLRFAACLLRIADVLDFDPERTPGVVYQHRDVDAPSAIFWAKDHQLGFAHEDDRLVIHARLPDAYLHRAVLQTVSGVDAELALCRRLADETHFDRVPGLATPQPYRWPLESRVHATVAPREGTYVYIDGSFRPNVTKVLELLGGIELYGTRMAAVRELLQNAFDAVRERIARQRLQTETPMASETVDRIRALHHVTIRVEPGDEGVQVICADSGIGMTKAMIRDRFLVSGATPRHQERELERECRRHGFSVGRTARFGIGVLSYFLLGSRVVVRTKRSEDAPDSEAQTWRFETRGTDDFGELRPAGRDASGTEVRLLLRSHQVGGDPSAFCEDLRQYLADTLDRVPCPFKARFEGTDVPGIECDHGWVPKTQSFIESIEEDLTPDPAFDPGAPVPEARRAEAEAGEQWWQDVREALTDTLEWERESGAIPDGLGSFRLSLAKFVVDGEVALAYIASPLASEARPRLVVPDSASHASWNGISVEELSRRDTVLRTGCSVQAQIDWESDAAGTLGVSRAQVNLSEEGYEARRWVNQRAKRLAGQVARRQADGRFSLLNRRLAGVDAEPGIPLYWPLFKGQEWEAIRFPVVSADTHTWPYTAERNWRGEGVTTVRTLEAESDARFDIGVDLYWNPPNCPPTHVVVDRSGGRRNRIRPLWARDTRAEALSHPAGAPCEFSPAWDLFVAVDLRHSGSPIAVNSANPVISAIDDPAWEWCREASDEWGGSHPDEGQLFASRSRVAAWLVRLSFDISDQLDPWQWMIEQGGGVLTRAWELLFPDAPDTTLYYVRGHYSGPGLLESLSPSARTTGDIGEHPEVLPDPGEDWTLVNAELPYGH